MNLEILTARAQEIEAAIANTTAQLTTLYGHKAEVAHWISQLPTPEPEANETQVESSLVTMLD